MIIYIYQISQLLHSHIHYDNYMKIFTSFSLIIIIYFCTIFYMNFDLENIPISESVKFLLLTFGDL
jgi:hypothetical protein